LGGALEEESQSAEAEPVKTLLLTELGNTLPIGVGNQRSIAFRPWRLKEEKKLAELKKKNKNATLTKYVNFVLTTMCTELAGENFSNMQDKDKERLISSLYIGDVLYAYVLLRREAIGSVVTTKLICEACSHEYNYAADLDTLEVTIPEKTIEDTFWKYTLRHPMKVRNDTINGFTLGPVKWSVLETAAVGKKNEGEIKAKTIRGSIKNAILEDGSEKDIVLTDEDLDELSKLDFEYLVKNLDDHHIGPDMSVDCLCPSCGHEYKLSINWANENFFGASSQ